MTMTLIRLLPLLFQSASRMSMRAGVMGLLLFVGAVGCLLREPGDFQASATDDVGTTSTGTASGAGETTGAGTTIVTAPEPTTGGGATTGDVTGTVTGEATGSLFIVPPDGGGTMCECDPWKQDCPEGQKCMPYSGDGDNSWDSLKCVDVVPDPDGVNEPCMVFGSGVSGEDSCDVGLMCWDVVDGMGHCVAMCIGSPDAPGCAEPGTECYISGDGVLLLCLPQCSPLLQDCPSGELCIPNPQVPGRFLCVLDGSGDEGQAFDPCEYASACDPGLGCLEPAAASECDPQARGCCTAFCDVTLANTCPGQGQECVPWGADAPMLANVGVCTLP